MHLSLGQLHGTLQAVAELLDELISSCLLASLTELAGIILASELLYFGFS